MLASVSVSMHPMHPNMPFYTSRVTCGGSSGSLDDSFFDKPRINDLCVTLEHGQKCCHRCHLCSLVNELVA